MSENEVVSQWVDPDEVRSLAEGLLAKTPVSQMPSHESVFGKSFEGFDDESAPSETVPVPVAAPAPPKEAVRVEQKPTSIVAEPVTPVQQPDPQPEPAPPISKETQPDPFRTDLSRVAPIAQVQKASPFKVASSKKPAPKSHPVSPSLPKALNTFAGWLKKQTPIHAAFLCDPKGKVVLDEIGSEKLIKVARSLSLASLSKGASGSGGLLQVEIAKNQMMEILPLRSEEGHSIAGLVVARPLASEALVTIRRSFETALSRSSTSGE